MKFFHKVERGERLWLGFNWASLPGYDASLTLLTKRWRLKLRVRYRPFRVFWIRESRLLARINLLRDALRHMTGQNPDREYAAWALSETGGDERTC